MAALPDYNKIVFDECAGKDMAVLVPEASEQVGRGAETQEDRNITPPPPPPYLSSQAPLTLFLLHPPHQAWEMLSRLLTYRAQNRLSAEEVRALFASRPG